MIFADDLQIYLSCSPSDLSDALSKISEDVRVIAQYARDNGLRLNLEKTKILIQGSSSVFINRLNLNFLPPIEIKGKILTYVSEVRNLGVLMSSNLS